MRAKPDGMNSRLLRGDLKRLILTSLASTAPLEEIAPRLFSLPGRKIINPLFSALCSTEQRTRWRAIVAMGLVVARLAERDLEPCQVIMRRLMWSLNDESGGIGWGAPEAMASIMADSKELAAEYAHILVSYMREDGNFLEHEGLQEGLLWGISRLAQVQPGLLLSLHAEQYLLPYLASENPAIRGLTALAFSLLDVRAARAELEALLKDQREFTLYRHPDFLICRVCDIAAQALAPHK